MFFSKKSPAKELNYNAQPFEFTNGWVSFYDNERFWKAEFADGTLMD